MQVTIWVDALGPQLTGIGRYTWELCRRLRTHPDIKSLHFFARSQLLNDPGRLREAERFNRGMLPIRLLKRVLAKRTLRSTLTHGPNFFLPPAAERGIITVHDLSVLRFPETHPRERVLDFERRLAGSIERAEHIITDTETVRQEVIAEFGLPPSRVTAVPLGISPAFRPQSAGALRAALAPLGLTPGAYGLCVATLEPRKKISELIAAWGDLPPALRLRFPLVLAGGKGWQNADLHERVADAESEGWLRHLGFVDEKHLPSLYAGAALFAYPSTYEGFGLPPLEAMASGVPVMVAGRSCLPEVCGGVARYVDPDDRVAFRDAIESALDDDGWRQSAAIAGQAHAAAFTWDRCIDETVAVYRRVDRGG